MRLAIEVADAVLIDCALENDCGPRTAFPHCFFERRSVRPVAHKAQADLAALRGERRHRVDQHALTFRSHQAAYADDFEGIVVGAKGRGAEKLRIHAEGRDTNLVPVFRRREFHELAACIESDSAEQARGGNFFFELVARHIVEFVRTMHRDGKRDREHLSQDQPHARRRSCEVDMQMP